MPCYATRNHAFVPAVTWTLDGAELRCDDGGGPPRRYALKDVCEMRLEFCPTRPERNRYRCRLRFARGGTVEFYNRTYRGVYDFADTSPAYVAIVSALLAALREHAPACRCITGTGAANYALGVIGFVLACGAVLLVLVFALTSGLWWLVLLKAAIIVFYLPTAWRWLRRNRERDFDPRNPPSDLLPRI